MAAQDRFVCVPLLEYKLENKCNVELLQINACGAVHILVFFGQEVGAWD